MRRFEWKALTLGEKQAALCRPAISTRPDLTANVAEVIRAVRGRGDAAVRELTHRWDGVELSTFEVSAEEWAGAKNRVTSETRKALATAAANIERFHRAQLPSNVSCEIAAGIRCDRETRPISRVGLYAPGGSASLPSTVLMLGVPSRLAGAPLRVLATPPRKDGSVDPHILEAASLCGIERVLKIGGAQAIAALAFGTESVPKVDKIFGPGNAWVTEAKCQVSQHPNGAQSDMPAGPSEVLVIADKEATPSFVASDLLSQAEHGPDSQVVLVSDSSSLIEAVEGELERQLALLPRAEIARAALTHSLAIQVDSLTEAFAVSNAYAPEHLILQVRSAARWKSAVTDAGSVFLGAWSPESAGDYASGTNHVLPTYGYARAVSGLSVDSFLKQITFQELTPEGLTLLGPTIEHLAEIEGLEAHRRAVSLRLASLSAEGAPRL